MNLAVLKAEITNDPLGVGYASKSHQQIADALNSKTRERNITSLTPTQVLNAINYSEWTNKTATQQQFVWNMLGMGAINPWGVEAQIFTTVFGAGSQTIASLAGLRKQSVSRAEELGLETVSVGYIQEAIAFEG